MEKVVITLILTLFLVTTLTTAQEIELSNRYSYNLYPYIPSMNVTINVSTNSSLYWDTGDHGALRNVEDIRHDWLDTTSLLWSNADHVIDTTLDMNSNDITEVHEIFGENIYLSGANGNQRVQINNSNPFGFSRVDLCNSAQQCTSFAKVGGSIPSIISNGYSFGGNASGLVNFASNENLFLLTSDNGSIIFGSAPEGNTSNSEFIVAIDPLVRGISFLDSKYIRSVPINGGSGLLFQSVNPLVEGGFPYIWVATDSQNNTLVSSWQQVGRNNSFSGQMNSFGLVPKNWVNFTGEPVGEEEAGIDFLFNVSDYIKYCEYLQDNLSLIPAGCQYFADTTGRQVPLLFAGDLEIHRSAVIHEGFQGFNTFSNLDFTGSPFEIFNSSLLIASVFRTQEVNISSEFAEFEITFDGRPTGNDISPFVRETFFANQRDWSLRNSGTFCVDNPCLRAKGGDGGAQKIMSLSQSSEGISNITLGFYHSHNNMDPGEFLIVELTDNQGNTTQLFSYEGDGSDFEPPVFVSFNITETYWDKPNNTVRFYHNASANGEESYIDNFYTSGFVGEDQLFNISVEDALIEFGERDCNINVTGDFFGDYMNVTCPTFTVESNDTVINSLKGTYTGGSAYVCVYDNGTLYTDEVGC